MAGKKLRSIRGYLYQNGRYLDVARWNYHFEGASEKEVLKALFFYQNKDGGFAHGLEPDNQSPVSNPIATWEAVSLLRELDFPEDSKRMLQKILQYLEDTLEEETLIWKANALRNNPYPHAPWWDYEEGNSFGYNPSAEFVGILLGFADPSSRIYAKALASLKKMAEEVQKPSYSMGSHELSNFLNLYRDLQKADKLSFLPQDFCFFLKNQVDTQIERDPKKYKEDHYYTPPSRYVVGKQDFFYKGNEEICAFYAGYLEDCVTQEGYWKLNWTWGDRPMPERVIRDWRGKLIVDHMLFMERIVK